MRQFAGPIVLLSTVALLTLQSAGLHLHANPHTDGMQLHAEHVHDRDPDGHDHSADVDVTIFELSTLWAKLTFLLPLLGLDAATWRAWFPVVPIWQFLTYGFLHSPDSLMHIGGNMLML